MHMERFSQAHVVSRDQKLDLEDMMYLVLLPLSFTKLNPWRSTTADFSANSLDLNKSPSSNGNEDLQKEFNSDNELMKISNEPEEDGMIMRPKLSFLTVINCSNCHSPLHPVSYICATEICLVNVGSGLV
ncbi:hypothetical protein SUGI_0561130 [Cryptomeria japonica]|nr:hypothetical protein SUGI_0561130 [Cryptomeria japonica]